MRTFAVLLAASFSPTTVVNKQHKISYVSVEFAPVYEKLNIAFPYLAFIFQRLGDSEYAFTISGYQSLKIQF